MPTSHVGQWTTIVSEFSDVQVSELHALISATDYRFDNPTFRSQADILEAELRRRGVDFAPIVWTVSVAVAG